MNLVIIQNMHQWDPQALQIQAPHSIIIKMKGKGTDSMEGRAEVSDKVAGGQKLGRAQVLRLFFY